LFESFLSIGVVEGKGKGWTKSVKPNTFERGDKSKKGSPPLKQKL
jgi:hypothetical protein